MRKFDIKELHCSEINTFFKCGEQFRRRYVLGEIRPPGIALIVGTSVHSGIEANLLNKMETKKPLPLSDVLDATNDSFKAEMRNGVEISEKEKLIGIKTIKKHSLEMALALGKIHHSNVAPSIEPIAVEKPFVLKAKNFNIGGRIDIVEDGKLRDTKTSKASPNINNLNNELQSTTYCMARYIETGEVPEFYYDYLVKNKTPKEKTVKIRKKTKEDFNAALSRFDLAYNLIKKEVFVPASPGSWWCSEYWCGYWKDCIFTGGRTI